MKIKVKLNSIDDELMYKNMDVVISSSKKFQTPIKTSSPEFKISEINEIFRSFKEKSINDALSNEKIERRYDSEIKRKMVDGINFTILKYTDIKILSNSQIEYLADLQYARSDVVITPIWSKIIKEKTEDDLIDTFLNLTNKYITIIETLNNKSIIGIIPSRIPRIYLDKIIKNYVDREVTSFILDMDGRGFDNNMSWVRNLWRLLKSYDLIENTFLYAINASSGKFMKEKTSILAKDFMNLGFGVDLIGLNHVPLRLPTEQWRKIKEQRRENTFRIFNKETYAYDRINESKARDYLIFDRKSMKKYNISEQFKESEILSKKIIKEPTILPYISKKEQVNEKILKKIKNLRNKTFK
ncbi:MAG: hypothetical protein ACTSWX_00690 [Promethearchaeota archaeon]